MRKFLSIVATLLPYCGIALFGLLIVAIFGVIGWVIESDIDLFPDRNGGTYLAQYTDIPDDGRDVYVKNFCFLECDRYFSFDTTGEEIDQLIKQKSLDKIPYYKAYSTHLIRFQPGEETTLYHQGNFFLYYDTIVQRAYVMIIDR